MRLRQAKRDGWLQFCQRLGVNPDAMAAPFLEHVDRAMKPAEAVSEILDEDGGAEPCNAELLATGELETLVDAWGID